MNGQNDLMRQYRSQHALPGLVVDERFNMGGALGDRLVGLLNRPALDYLITHCLRSGMVAPKRSSPMAGAVLVVMVSRICFAQRIWGHLLAHKPGVV
jgi:hypothetical protein